MRQHWVGLRMIRSFKDGESGVALIEFAVTVPLFVFLLTALFDFSRLTLEQIFLEDAVESAGRFGAAQSGNCLNQAIQKLEHQLKNGIITKDLDFKVARSEIFTNEDGISGILLDVTATTSCYYCGWGMHEKSASDGQALEPGFTFNSTGFYALENQQCGKSSSSETKYHD